jgi:uncharacterized iron-regulated membrane protein
MASALLLPQFETLMNPSLRSREPMPRRVDGALYRIVWRWHFFAGLICLPVLVLMASTGALYLFRDEINDAVYRDWRLARVSDAPPAALSAVVQQVQQAEPGEVTEIGMPAAPDRSLRLVIKASHGNERVVYADPRSGQVLGAIDARWQWDELVPKLHSMALLGRWANIAVEIVAGWCIVLIVSGVFLWWPRHVKGGVLSVRGVPRQRLWWRDLHAVTGAVAGLVVLFLAVTGMPWSALWGERIGALTQAHGLGVPPAMWDAVPTSTVPMSALGAVPWTLEHAPLPKSEDAPHGAHAAGSTRHGADAGTAAQPIGIDRAAAIAAAAGIARDHTLFLPKGEQGVYNALVWPHDVQRQRALHIDQYSGRVLADVSYADYGAVAKVTEWGIAVHKGKQYGVLNQALMLLGCLTLITLAMTSVVMWIKRKPQGALGAPQRQHGDRWAVAALAVAAVLGLVFPPLGASMLIAAAIDALVRKSTTFKRTQP